LHVDEKGVPESVNVRVMLSVKTFMLQEWYGKIFAHHTGTEYASNACSHSLSEKRKGLSLMMTCLRIGTAVPFIFCTEVFPCISMHVM
jgi:hypothetical protein